jgi:hypothetical protein
MAHASRITTHESRSIEQRQLAGTIADMDDLAQAGFASIAQAARKALEAMKQAPKGHPLHRSLEATLDAIWQVADMAANDINCEAEGVAARPVGGHTGSASTTRGRGGAQPSAFGADLPASRVVGSGVAGRTRNRSRAV